MMSLQMIHQLNDAATRRSRRARRVPVEIPSEALERASSLADLAGAGFRIPFIGYRLPEGFETVGEEVFIDISGSGADYESALSFRQALEHIRQMTLEHGPLYWGLTETGEFQGYLQAWRRLP